MIELDAPLCCRRSAVNLVPAKGAHMEILFLVFSRLRTVCQDAVDFACDRPLFTFALPQAGEPVFADATNGDFHPYSVLKVTDATLLRVGPSSGRTCRWGAWRSLPLPRRVPPSPRPRKIARGHMCARAFRGG